MPEIQPVSDADFAATVECSGLLFVVDFSAEWCPPCRLVTPILESLAREYTSRIQVVSLDVDTNPAISTRFRIRSLPTVLFFRDGVVVDRIVGAAPRNAFQQKFEALLRAEPAIDATD
jgi:thioredoxin 1